MVETESWARAEIDKLLPASSVNIVLNKASGLLVVSVELGAAIAGRGAEDSLKIYS